MSKTLKNKAGVELEMPFYESTISLTL